MLELDKFNVIANFGLAKILVEKKEFKKALEYLKNIITKKSDKETLSLVKICLSELKDTNTLNSLS